MGRGTAILKFGSALDTRKLPGPSAQRLFHWLELQLETRGVDPAPYSRYLVSLLQLDDAEFDRDEISDRDEFEDNNSNSSSSGASAAPSAAAAAGAGGSDTAAGKKSGKRLKRKKQSQQQQQQQQPDCGISQRKRNAAVRCLRSVCNDPYDLDELIDELCYRLKQLDSGGGSGAFNFSATSPRRHRSRRAFLRCRHQQQLPQVPESDEQPDSGRAATPEDEEEEAAEDGEDWQTEGGSEDEEQGEPGDIQVVEEYTCAFPALSAAAPESASAKAAVGAGARQSAAVGSQRRGLQQQLLGAEQASGVDRASLGSAWARGPPRSLVSPHSRHQHQRQSMRRRRRQMALLQEDEGFLDVLTGGAFEEAPGAADSDGDDAASVASSQGSDILRLVSHILHSFNRELEDEEQLMRQASTEGRTKEELDTKAPPASGASELVDDWLEVAAAAAAAVGGDECDVGSPAGEDKEDGDKFEMVEDEISLVPALPLMAVAEDEQVLSDHDFDDLPSQEDPDLTEASALQLPPLPPPPPVAVATGRLTLPKELVLLGMACWTPLDRMRHEMWSKQPLPPRQPRQSPQRQKPAPSSQLHHHPMTPLEKSKRACSFLLRGRCKKEDCEFAHDLTKVTCKFWSSGECFKGDTCPFLHGYTDEGQDAEEPESGEGK